jgi:hypothetical protein
MAVGDGVGTTIMCVRIEDFLTHQLTFIGFDVIFVSIPSIDSRTRIFIRRVYCPRTYGYLVAVVAVLIY